MKQLIVPSQEAEAMSQQEPRAGQGFARHAVLCGALLAVAIVLAIVLGAAPLLAFALICLGMVGAMLWMMRGGQGHGHH